MSFFDDEPALGQFSCNPDVKEAYPEFWKTEFPEKGYKRCWSDSFYNIDGSRYNGIQFDVECYYHNQTNLFSCALLKDDTICILHVGPNPGFSEDGIIPVSSPYSTIFIPDEILGKKVTQIGRGCRKHDMYASTVTEGLEGLKELVLPDTITQINDEAFGGEGDTLGSFTDDPFKLNIPDSVTKIGERVFIRDSFQSPSIDISISPEQESFTVINEALFDKKNRRLIAYTGRVHRDIVKSYVIPQGIHYVEPYSFKDAGKFSKISIPSSVKRIGESAFFNCEIEELIIHDGVETIERYAFKALNKAMKKVELPSSIKEIGIGAFSYTPEAVFIIPRDSYVAKWAIEENKTREYTDALDWLKE